jgi:hypothetical protein
MIKTACAGVKRASHLRSYRDGSKGLLKSCRLTLLERDSHADVPNTGTTSQLGCRAEKRFP